MYNEYKSKLISFYSREKRMPTYTEMMVLFNFKSKNAVARLVDMGIEPYLIPPVLIASVAQRLVRTLCAGTGKEAPMSPSIRKNIEEELSSLPKQFHFDIPDVINEPERSPGCTTGLRGRMAVFEALEMSSEIEKIVLDNPVDSKLWAVARSQGMLTMQEDAMLKAFDKKVPFSEVSTLSTLLLASDEEEVAPVVETVEAPGEKIETSEPAI